MKAQVANVIQLTPHLFIRCRRCFEGIRAFVLEGTIPEAVKLRKMLEMGGAQLVPSTSMLHDRQMTVAIVPHGTHRDHPVVAEAIAHRFPCVSPTWVIDRLTRMFIKDIKEYSMCSPT